MGTVHDFLAFKEQKERKEEQAVRDEIRAILDQFLQTDIDFTDLTICSLDSDGSMINLDLYDSSISSQHSIDIFLTDSNPYKF